MKKQIKEILKYHLEHTTVLNLKTSDSLYLHQIIYENLKDRSSNRVFDIFFQNIREVFFTEIKGLSEKTVIFKEFNENYEKSFKEYILDFNDSKNAIIIEIGQKIDVNYLENIYHKLKNKNIKNIIISNQNYDSIYIKNIDILQPEQSEIEEIVSNFFRIRGVQVSIDFIKQTSSYLTGLPITSIQNTLEYALFQKKENKIDFFKTLLKEKKSFFKLNVSMDFIEEDENITDLGGQNSLKQWLKERQKAFSPKARELGIPYPKGVLLVGIQGCGKSLTAKAVAGLWKLPLLKMDFSLLFTSNKTAEETFKENLKIAETLSPIILWLDEIDKLFSASSSGAVELKRIFATFLTWLQEKKELVFVIATANKIDDIPPELLRKGRFDEIFFLDLPSKKERIDIFKIHMNKRDINLNESDIENFANKTEFFSGAEIEQIVISAIYRAFDSSRAITEKDFLYSIEQTIPFYKTYEEEIKKLKDWATHKARKASDNQELYELFN
ncbi:AAA family ATPase [bacterium]|nr:AAA family ATPase [bacterium]